MTYPAAEMVRQILGVVSQFEKASLVAKMRGARDRASKAAGWREADQNPCAFFEPEPAV